MQTYVNNDTTFKNFFFVSEFSNGLNDLQIYILEYHSKFIDHHIFELSMILRGSYDKILLFKLMDVESDHPHPKMFCQFSIKKSTPDHKI